MRDVLGRGEARGGGQVQRRPRSLVAALVAVAASAFALSATSVPSWPEREALLTPATWRMGDPTGWLGRGQVPGGGTRWEPMVQDALIDLHQLSTEHGGVAAGASGRWDYAWPRDSAFVAVAFARSGHGRDAWRVLDFLADVPAADGLFEARYLLDGSGPPDDRPRQSDGAGWALWAVGEVMKVTGELPDEKTRSLVDRCASAVLAQTDDGRELPPPSRDYWEVAVDRVTLGTVAPMLAGLRSAQDFMTVLADPDAADRVRQAAGRLRARVKAFAGDRFERFGRTGGLDAAVTFLMPPYADPDPAASRAFATYQRRALRAAGGLAPGVSWRADGITWTPETALAAYAAASSGDVLTAGRWLDWLLAHRVPWGSLPEKVNRDGSAGGPAPLAWTAALVVLTVERLDRQAQ